MRTWPVPLPSPIQLRATVAAAEGYLFIATTDAVIQEVLAVKAGQHPGLSSTQEFQRLAKDVPAQGNSFGFVSQRFGQAMSKVWEQVFQTAGNPPGSHTALLQFLFGSGKASAAYVVAANTDQGWLAVANGNHHPAALLAMAATFPVGILGAVAIPSFVKARPGPMKPACINNLRQIRGAKHQWALENQKADADTPARADLEPYFLNKQFPACPDGGTYTINRVSDPPECSHAGHKLAD
jgi:hypothetical protein